MGFFSNFKLILILAGILLFTGLFNMTYSEERIYSRTKAYEMYAEHRKSFPSIDEYLPEEAVRQLKNKNLLFIDVRNKKEIEVSKIFGAVTRDEFLEKIDSYRDRTLIAYCTIGYRSGLFALEMKKKGIKVYNLSAGILGWLHADGIVYDSRGPVKRVHIYGKKWNLAPPAYKTVTFSLFEKIFD